MTMIFLLKFGDENAADTAAPCWNLGENRVKPSTARFG